MKKYLIIFILSFSLFTAYSQDSKYLDIIELLNNQSYSEAYNQLFDYQQIHPDFANVYIQLGNISYYWAINSDPFTDIEQTEYYIYNVKLYYGLALNKLLSPDNDVKNQQKYYQNISEFKDLKKLDNSIVIDYIDKKLDSIKEYDKNAHSTTIIFKKFNSTYNKTLNEFLSIINTYKNIADINLQPRLEILKKTNDLIVSYDSTIFYYQKYRDAITNYPIKNFNQQLVAKPINTYRLQGITPSAFFDDTIYIWDYKSWALDIQKNLTTDINHLRETISKTNKELRLKENELKNTVKYSNAYKKYILEQKVIFEIEKFDHNSIITSLFEYLDAKIDFQVQSKRVFNDTASYSISAINRAIEYTTLIDKKITLDSLLNNLSNNISQGNYIYHKDFFDYNYNGLNGLKNFLSTEQLDNEIISKETIENLKYIIFRDIYNRASNKAYVDYNGTKIPMFVQYINPLSANQNNYYTTDISNYITNQYITGYYKTATGTSAFVAKISYGNIEWLKTTSTSTDIYEYGLKIKAGEKGCTVIIHNNNKNQHQNDILFFSSEGKQISKQKLNNSDYPRILEVDDINNEALIAFQGKNLDYFSDTSDPLEIQKINTTNLSLLWKLNIKLEGKLINIIKIESNYHLIANYNKLIIDGKMLSSTNNSIVNITTDLNGKVLKSDELKISNYIWGIYAFKINNNTINLIGLVNKSNICKSNFSTLPSANSIIFSPDNIIYFQSLK